VGSNPISRFPLLSQIRPRRLCARGPIVVQTPVFAPARGLLHAGLGTSSIRTPGTLRDIARAVCVRQPRGATPFGSTRQDRRGGPPRARRGIEFGAQAANVIALMPTPVRFEAAARHRPNGAALFLRPSLSDDLHALPCAGARASRSGSPIRSSPAWTSCGRPERRGLRSRARCSANRRERTKWRPEARLWQS
jgi:hypothetical protein